MLPSDSDPDSAIDHRFKPLFADDPVTSAERQYHLQQFGKRAGWDDPAMNVYEDLDPRSN